MPVDYRQKPSGEIPSLDRGSDRIFQFPLTDKPKQIACIEIGKLTAVGSYWESRDAFENKNPGSVVGGGGGGSGVETAAGWFAQEKEGGGGEGKNQSITIGHITQGCMSSACIHARRHAAKSLSPAFLRSTRVCGPGSMARAKPIDIARRL